MTAEKLKDKMDKFGICHIIFIPNHGHLVWRYGTGGNVEIFDIEAYEKRKGIGKELIARLIEEIKENPPNSIFGFTMDTNKQAHKFYKAMGFHLSHCINNLYKYPRGARLFVATYKEIKNHAK